VLEDHKRDHVDLRLHLSCNEDGKLAELLFIARNRCFVGIKSESCPVTSRGRRDPEVAAELTKCCVADAR